MKKILIATLAAVAVLASTSCSFAAWQYKAPDMGSPSALEDSGASASPSSSESKAMAADLIGGISSTAASGAAGSYASQAPGARFLHTETPINYSYDYTSPDGKVSITGSQDGTVSYLSADPNKPGETMAPNKTYEFMSLVLNMSMEGKLLNGATVSGSSGTLYTIVDANFENRTDMDLVINTKTDAYALPTTWTMNLKFGTAFGYAMSVVRQSDGVGAKFIISYGGVLVLDDVSLQSGLFSGALDAKLHAETATLSAYDDADRLLYTAQVPLDELNQLQLP